MTNKASGLAMILSMGLASVTGVETAEASETVTVRVRVENAADIPRRIIDGAQADATRIYRDAGIEIVWLNRDDEETRGNRVIRVIVPTLKGADTYLRLGHVDKNALAEADAGTRLIHVFWERLQTSASRQGREEGGLLGVVLAHEIGHVLLPGAGHSPTGVMRAAVEVRMLAPLRFTNQQSEAMREHLRPAPDAPVPDTQAITIR